MQNGALVNTSGTNTYSGLLTLGANSTISADSGTINITNVGTITGATHNLTLTGVGTGTISSIIGTTTGTVTKSGTGTWTLSGANTFSGGATLSAGTLIVANTAAVGTGTLTLSGGTLQSGGSSAAATLANVLSVTASTTTSLTDSSAGDLTLNGAISGSGTLSINSTVSNSLWLGGDPTNFTGTINFTDNSAGVNFRLQGSATNFSGVTFNLSGATSGRELFWVPSSTVTIQMGSLAGSGGLLGGSGGASGFVVTFQIGALNASTTFSGLIANETSLTALTKVGTGTLTLGGANTYTGVTTIQNGILSATSLAVGGSASSIGASTNAATNLVLSGGTLQYTGGTATTDRLFTLTNAGTVDGSGSGGLTFSNTGKITVTSAATLTLTGTSTANVFTPIISDLLTGTANTSLIKAGAGTWTLGGVNTYSGGTTVSAGTLQAQPTTIGSGGGPLAVNAGAVLSLTGLTSASSSIQASTLTLGTSGTGATVTLALNNATTSGNAVFNVVGSGGLTLNGTTTINFSNLQAQQVGEIPLIAYSGAQVSSGLAVGTVLPTPHTVASIDYSNYNSGASTGLIQLNVTAGGSITWTGSISANWDVGSSVGSGGTNNWTWNGPATATNFVNGDYVIFDNSASGTGAVGVSLAVTASPQSVVFNNGVSRAYTISGAGSIGGSGSVSITGGGVVTLLTLNTYTGGTILSSGQLNINAGGTTTASSIGTGVLTIAASTTIDNTSGLPVTVATNNAQTWNGNFTFGGSNALNLGTGAVTLGTNVTVNVNGALPTHRGRRDRRRQQEPDSGQFRHWRSDSDRDKHIHGNNHHQQRHAAGRQWRYCRQHLIQHRNFNRQRRHIEIQHHDR